MASHRTATFDVSGMSCGSCVRHIDAAVRKLPGVTEVTVDLDRGRVAVAFDEGASDVGAIAAAITAQGYGVTPAA